jgi:hypothetical protein
MSNFGTPSEPREKRLLQPSSNETSPTDGEQGLAAFWAACAKRSAQSKATWGALDDHFEAYPKEHPTRLVIIYSSELWDFAGAYGRLPQCSNGWDLWGYIMRSRLQPPLDDESNHPERGLFVGEAPVRFAGLTATSWHELMYLLAIRTAMRVLLAVRDVVPPDSAVARLPRERLSPDSPLLRDELAALKQDLNAIPSEVVKAIVAGLALDPLDVEDMKARLELEGVRAQVRVPSESVRREEELERALMRTGLPPARTDSPVEEVQSTSGQNDTLNRESTTIVYLKEKAYFIGNSDPITVTDSEHAILQEFIAVPSMDAEMLQSKAGNDRAPRILRNLTRKYDGAFATAIRLPGGKGKGGYHVSVKAARSDGA